MSVPPAPYDQPAARHRPGTVTTAAILMFLITGISLLFAVLTIVSAAVISDDQIREMLEKQQPQMPDEQLDATVALFKPTQYAAGVLLVVFAIVLAVLAVLVYRGSRVGRILTWVVTGLYAFCGLCLAGGAAGSSAAAGGGVLGLLIPVLLLLGSLAVILLLALPASNPYFAKPVPQWQPPSEFSTPLGQAGPPPTAPQVTPHEAPPTPPVPPQEGPATPPPAGQPPAGQPSPEAGPGEAPPGQPPSGSQTPSDGPR